MSVQAIGWAFKQSPGSPLSKFVLVAVANYADENGYCWPSQRRLTRDTGLSRGAVKEHLKRLEKDGLLRREKRRDATSGRQRSDAIFLMYQQPRGHEMTPEAKPGVTTRPPGGSPDDPGLNRPKPAGDCAGSTENQGDEPGSSGDPLEPSIEKDPSGAPTAARDPQGAAPVDAQADDEPTTPVNALWKERMAALEKAIGKVPFRNWFAGVIPHADEGEVYVLAAPSKFTADWITRQYAQTLRLVLGKREIRVEFHRYAQAAEQQAKRKAQSHVDDTTVVRPRGAEKT